MKQLSDESRAVVDPNLPWKLPTTAWKRPRHPFTMSVSEWQALLTRAKRGDSNAEWEVAEKYEDGCKDKAGRIVVRCSTRRAAEWLQRAAHHGCTSAQNNLGVSLGNGPDALAWLKKAFRAGETCAATNIAVTHRNNGNLRRAVHWFRESVASGDDEALIQLGIHYYWGKGVKKDACAAVRCFRKATRGRDVSESGRDDAFFYLGIAYYEGNGVKASSATARKLFRRANVDDDHPAARAMLRKLT